MKIFCSMHSLERAVERKGIKNLDEARKYLEKKFKAILKKYREWNIHVKYENDKSIKNRLIIKDKNERFIFEKSGDDYSIITYCNYTHGKLNSPKMNLIKEYMKNNLKINKKY